MDEQNKIANKSLSAGVVSGVLGLAGQGLNFFSQKANNEQMYRYNKRLAEDAYERNLRMWREQVAYNSPEMQVARLRAAGVNPALAFGSGNLTGNAEAAPELAYSEYNPKAPLFDASSPISSAISSSEVLSRIALNRSMELKNLRSESYTQAQEEFYRETMADQALRIRLSNDKLYSDLEYRRKEVGKLDIDTKLQEKVLQWYDTIQGAIYENYIERTELTKAQREEVGVKITNYLKQNEKLDQEINSMVAKLQHEIAEIDSRTALNYSAAALNQERIKMSQLEQQDLTNSLSIFDKEVKALDIQLELLANELKLSTKDVKSYFWTKILGPAARTGASAVVGLGAALIKRGK